MEDKSKSVFDKKTDEKVVKLNGNREMVVDISSVESLLNAINYATSKLERADALTNADGLEKAINRVNSNIRMLIEEQLPNFEKKQEKHFSKMPDNALLKNLSFEMEKISGFDKSIKKIKSVNIAVTAILTAVITIGAMSYSKFDDQLIKNYILSNLGKKNYVLDRGAFKLESNGKTRVVFTRTNQK